MDKSERDSWRIIKLSRGVHLTALYLTVSRRCHAEALRHSHSELALYTVQTYVPRRQSRHANRIK